MTTWIFQATTARFDLNGLLLSRKFIYLTVARYLPGSKTPIQPGEPAYIWRAGEQPGLVAFGTVAEAPAPVAAIRRPELRNASIRAKEPDAPGDHKVGVLIYELRLTAEDGMILRADFAAHGDLGSHAIIKARQGSAFRLTDVQADDLARLWAGARTSVSR